MSEKIKETENKLMQENEKKENEKKENESKEDINETNETNENLEKENIENNENQELKDNQEHGIEKTKEEINEKEINEAEKNMERAELQEEKSNLENSENQNTEKENEESNTETQKETQEETQELNNQEFEEIKEKLEKLQDNSYQEPVDFDEMYQKLFKTKPIKNEEKNDEENKINAIDIIKNNTSLFEEIEEYKKVPYKFIGIVFKTYIILEMNKEMYILDQHAAHERIMYEKVKKNYYSDKSKDSQMLLLPDIITLTHKEMDIAKENMAMFEKAGFSLEEFGENTIKLTGVPTVCIDLDTKDLFLETLDEINTVARTAKQEKEEKFIATVACKAAVKAHMALTVEEVDSLMEKLLELPNPFTCPHGRPTAIKMTQYDIEKKFARKQ